MSMIIILVLAGYLAGVWCFLDIIREDYENYRMGDIWFRIGIFMGVSIWPIISMVEIIKELNRLRRGEDL